MQYPKVIENLINKLSTLPGIGKRSAERIVFHLLSADTHRVNQLADNIKDLVLNMKFCKICNNLSETEICLICSDTKRQDDTICVVESPKDLLAIERSGVYKGLYHVLLGTISPADGRGPDVINIEHLINRIKDQDIKEVIIATDPDNEGEMTALYLTRQLRDCGVKISRIGMGLPMGSAVEFVDISTLGMSLKSRREITEHIL